MLCDTSDASCSDCKMEIFRNNWTAILCKWLNKCVHPGKVCTKLTPTCLADIMNKYKKDICDNDVDRAILCTDDIEPFIKYKYPILRLRYLSEDDDYARKQYIMTSVLLYHCCIKSHSGIVHEDIWKHMSKYEQEVILKFCERLDDMEITVNNVDCALKEAFDYVKYVQNVSTDDIRPSTLATHANTDVQTEITSVMATSSDKMQEEIAQTSNFNSSVTVLPSAIAETSTFSSLISDQEESSSSDDQFVNNTDSEDNGVNEINEFAEEKSHAKPYQRDTAPDKNLFYLVPEEMCGSKVKHKVKNKGQKCCSSKRDLETVSMDVETEDTHKEKHGKYIISHKGKGKGICKRGSPVRNRDDVLVTKQQDIFIRKQEKIFVNKPLEEVETMEDEFAPVRHETVPKCRRSNEKRRTHKHGDTYLKNIRHTTIGNHVPKCGEVKRYLSLQDIKHKVSETGSWRTREYRVKPKISHDDDICEIKSVIKHAARNKDFSVRKKHKSKSKYKAKSKSKRKRKSKHCAKNIQLTEKETSEEHHDPDKPEDCSCSHCLTVYHPKDISPCTSLRENDEEEQKLYKTSKFMPKSIHELNEKAKHAWSVQKYHICISAGIFTLIVMMLTAILVLMLVQPSVKKNKEETVSSFPKRFVRFVSNHIPYQQKHTWICKNNLCQIVYNDSHNNDSTYSSLSRCSLLCMGPQLWPYPTGYTYFSNEIVALETNKLEYKFQSIPSEAVHQYLGEAFKLFISDLARLESVEDNALNKLGKDLKIKHIFIKIDVETDPEPRLKLNTDESYNLKIDTVDKRIEVKISSASFCGVRHGLETLSQMILLDQTSGKLITVSKAVIKDGPTYKYRGLMIDTARNFIPIGDLLRTIDAMATVKLNTFHWRISDVTSFPLYLESIPMLFEYGAYSRSMIYTKEDVKFVVERATIRGIRVLIEVAAPGPVGRAWSWHPDVNCPPTNSGNSSCDNVLCLRFGLKDSVMTLLQVIYSEILEMTNVTDIFHLSDGIFSLSNCYSLIEDRKGFLNMALIYLKAANNGTLPKLPIIWQSPHLHMNFEAKTWEKLGVQVTEMPNDQAGSILSNFKVIHSTKWDLSCEIKKQRCHRYRTWQEMYSWKSWRNIEVFDIEGGEAILWTDLVDSGNLDSHLWPRAAAVAERLWSDAVANNSVSGPLYVRLDNQRWRMILNGVQVQPVWPLWCSMNPARCLEKVR